MNHPIFGDAKVRVSLAGRVIVCEPSDWEKGVELLEAKRGACTDTAAVDIVDADAVVTFPNEVTEAHAQASLDPIARHISESIFALETSKPERRPRSWMRQVRYEDLAWDPITQEQFTVDADYEVVRSGDSVAIVRREEGGITYDARRWPLGHVKSKYKPVSHRVTIAGLVEFGGNAIDTSALPWMDGPGYHVAHEFRVRTLGANMVAGCVLNARINVTHDNSGVGATGAALTFYVDDEPVGTMTTHRGLHVGEHANRWRGEVEAMVEKAILVQDALAAILRVAAATPLTDEHRVHFLKARMGINPKAEATTLLDACRVWHRVTRGNMTWPVWSRRLDDNMLRAMCAVLPAQLGRDLDSTMFPAGGRRYGRDNDA